MGEILDLAPGDLVVLRNGENAKVMKNDGHKIILCVQVRNGFGGILWEEAPFSVSAKTGFVSSLPDQKDVTHLAILRLGFFSWKIEREALEKRPFPQPQPKGQ